MNKKDVKNRSILLYIILVIILTGCGENNLTYIEDNYNIKTNYEYEMLDYSSFKNKVNNEETFLAIFTRNDCEYCVSFVKNFSEFMDSEYKNYVVYFIDSNLMTPEDKEDILVNFDISTVPSIVSVKGGRIINLEMGEPSMDRLNEIILELKGE